MAFSISVGLLLTLVSYVSASAKCCPDGHTQLRSSKDVCWEPKTNVTSSISLSCNSTIRFFTGYHINEADELKLDLGNDFDITFENNS